MNDLIQIASSIEQNSNARERKAVFLKQPLIIINLLLPPRIQYGVNSGGSPVMSRASGFRLEFIPIEIGAGMTFLEGPLRVTPEGQLKLRTIEKKEFGFVHGRMFAVKGEEE